MPAIFGFYDPDRLFGGEALDRMRAAVPMHPSQVVDIFVNSWAGIGIVNYAGHDGVAGKNQPVCYAVLGDLEGLADVTMPHAEVAVKAFADTAGPQKLEEIRGGFVAAVLNEHDGSLTLVTDRYASYPLYIARHQSAWIFASQIKTILAALPGKATLDQISVATMLSIGEVAGNRTLVDGVETLPSATVLKVSPEGVDRHKYWQYQYEENPNADWDEAVDQVGTALTAAVKRAMRGSHSLAVPLSGGLDSRFILDLACHEGARPAAYTWGIPQCRDVEYAQVVARHLGCSHEVYYFEPDYLRRFGSRGVWLTEGHTPATNFHVLPYVDELADRGHDVILDGFAGDVVLGGNFINNAWFDNPDLKASADAIWQWRRGGFDGGWVPSALAEAHAVAGEAFKSLYQTYLGESSMDKAMAFLIDNRLRRVTTCGSELFRSRMLVKQPFMDADVTEAIRTLPHAWRKRHHFYLAVLKRFAPRSATAPYQRTMLPASAPYALNLISMAFQRGYGLLEKRAGFPTLFKGKSPSDFPNWFRNELKGYVEEILLNERTLSRGAVPPDTIKQVVLAHINGESDFTSLIGAMLSIELFCREFLDHDDMRKIEAA